MKQEGQALKSRECLLKALHSMNKFIIIFLFFLGILFANFSEAGQYLIINAELNNNPVRFVFDTGAEVSVIFRHVAERLKLNVIPPSKSYKPRPGRVPMGKTEQCHFKIRPRCR